MEMKGTSSQGEKVDGSKWIKTNEPMERGMNDLFGLGSTFIPSTICRIGLMELTAKVDGLTSHLVLGPFLSSSLLDTLPLVLRRGVEPNGEDESGVDGVGDEDGDRERSDGDDGEGFILAKLGLSMMVIRN